ncbi:MAG TPA: UvrD-helicase domain-containing protein [Acidimicrobiia bacterium]|nr:UvrD-helicase domain-containing protein [Acidimicrobiia bacterium]
MTAVTTVDHEARARIRSSHEASLFVEAGAGTGKTRALVDRVVALVMSGVLELRELAAITFTEAAASELRDRIRAGLEAVAAGRGDPAPSAAEQARCRAALEQVDEAALSTLHGFAFRILSEHPLEAGLPPGFELLDEITARIAFEQHWAAFVDALFDDTDLEPVLLTALLLGLRVDMLHDVARALHESYDRIHLRPTDPGSLPPLDASPVVAALDEALALRSVCCDDEDKLACHLDRVAGFRHALAGATDRLDLLEWLDRGEPTKLTFPHGKKANWAGAIDDVKRALETAQEQRTALLDEQRRAVLAVLTSRAEAFVRGYADERRRGGRLEFHDLLVLAHDVLRSDPSVRAAVARRYPTLLLDEFQDTDPLQIEIAVLLATRDSDAGDKPWTEVTVEPGALVVVGDPKQSIYRFRRADLGVYHAAQRELGLEAQALVQNFRSVPGVLAFVNHVFDALFEESIGIQAAHVHLEAAREALAGRPPVLLFGDEDDAPIATVRAREAREVAEVVRRIKRERWPVVDPVTGAVHPARYRDVALLIPSRTVLPDLEDALERADVPVRVESQSLVFSTAEVRDLVSVLGAVDDPTDEIAVVAALRSPGFGCSDAALVEFAEAGGRWDYRRAAPESLGDAHPVVAGLARLHGLWSQRWWRTVSETVEAVVRELHLLELATARRRARDHWRRIRFLLDQARAWDDAGEAGLRAFVEWVQHQADERARVIESVAPEPDDDALRILTVHGAKGLEFPIVVLAGLNTRPPSRRSKVLWGDDGPEFTIGTKSSGSVVETARYAELERDERLHDEAERLRLLYVGMTRARDHLLVSLHRKTGQPCHAASIAAILDGAPAVALDAAATDEGASWPEADADARVRVRRPVDPALPARDRWSEERARVLAAAARPASVAATSIAARAAGPEGGAVDDPGLAKDEPADDRPAWRRGRAGTAVGRAVHAVLQTVALSSGAGLGPTARAQALAEGVPEREGEIRRLAESALAAPVVRAAVEGGWRAWREVPVATEVGGVLLEGFVDLLVEQPDGDLVVVDWKTDGVRAPDGGGGEELDAALARYSVQGAAYALALESVLGRRVARCVFVFARAPGGAVEREVVDLGARIDAVRAELAGLGAGP